jgi:predicted HAD superfamily hydrolase
LVLESASAASSGLTIHSFTHRDRGVHRTGTNVRLLSLDVFDTTLCRSWFEPCDVFRVLARRLRADGIALADENTLFEARIAAEARSRAAASHGETTLTLIHALMSELVPLNAGPDETSRLELDIEFAATGLIGDIAALVRQAQSAGVWICYTTDTYLPSTAVKALLACAGAPAARVFASCELEASKRRGHIFARIAALYPDVAIRHIGDKHSADVIHAGAAGWSAQLYAAGRPNRYERALRAASWSDPLSGSAVAGAARAARLTAPTETGGCPAMRVIGADVGGPLFAAFAGWCLERARDLDLMLMLARDGQIVERTADILAPALTAPPDFRYAYASRQALYLPSIFAVGDEVWEWLESRLDRIQLVDCLARFGLEAEDADLFNACGLSPYDPIGRRAHVVRATLRSAPVAGKVLAEAARRRVLVAEYFREAIGTSRRIGIVDIGWKGRLQLCLERIFASDEALRAVSLRGFYLSLLPAATVLNENRAEAFAAYRHVAHPVLVEILASADHGSVLRYVRGAGGAVPVFEPRDEAALAWGVRDLQAGIAEFAKRLRLNARQGDIDLAPLLRELARPALHGLRILAMTPHHGEAEAMGAIMHSDDTSHIGLRTLAPHLKFCALARLAVSDAASAGEPGPFWSGGAIARSLPRQPRLTRALQAFNAQQIRLESLRAELRAVLRRRRERTS